MEKIEASKGAVGGVPGVTADAGVSRPGRWAAAEAQPPERSVLTSPVEHRVLTSSIIVRG